MMPKYKGDKYYYGFVGRYFKMIMEDESTYSYNKILSYDPDSRMFTVENCEISPGLSVISIIEKYYCFVDRDNFCEIPENDYEALKFLHRHSYFANIE